MAKILIADDDGNFLEWMLDVLQAAGHEVIAVRDGAAAIATLKSDLFDIAVLDVQMPKSHGYQVAAFAKKLNRPPAIVIETCRDYERDRLAAQAVGAAAFLTKPFSKADLSDAVSNVLTQVGPSTR